MLFNSLQFLFFFPAVCALYFALRSRRLRNLFLLAASYFFYMNWRAEYALLILWGTALTYFIALRIEKSNSRRARRWMLSVGAAGVLLPLFAFKYLSFAASTIAAILGFAGLRVQIPDFALLLPVGISFFSFQMIGYLVDVHRGKIEAEHDFATYALFISFFPQLVAGPIERAANLLPQFQKGSRFDGTLAFDGLAMMLWGYFMKLCVAERVAPYVDAVFNNWHHHNGTSLLLGAVFFSFRIYCDFCGYSLIARGAAAIMGFRLMENFRQPYLACGLKDFWRRWHISLSTWFMDYVYIPLGGNRCPQPRHLFNLMATFLLSGIWHGANWTFVAWGWLHGIALCIGVVARRILPENRLLAKTPLRIAGTAATFAFVTLAWVFFRADSLSSALGILGKIFTSPGPLFNGDGFPNQLLGIACIMLLMAAELKEHVGIKARFLTSGNPAVAIVSSAALLSVIMLTAVWHGGEFIYFQF